MSQIFSKPSASSSPPAAKAANAKKRAPLFTLQVTGPRLAAGIIAGIIAIGWIFLLGMVSGQMWPGILPSETDNPAPRVAIQEHEPTPQTPRGGVIPTEDLEYARRAELNTNAGEAATGGVASGSLGSPNAPAVSSGQIGGQLTAQAAPQPAAQPAPPPVRQPARQDPPRATTPPDPQSAAQPAGQAANPDQVFTYVYQVASFKLHSQAQSLVDKLTTDGVQCRIVQAEANGATWNRVMVDFTGTETDTRDLKNILGKYGIGQVVMYSKKPK